MRSPVCASPSTFCRASRVACALRCRFGAASHVLEAAVEQAKASVETTKAAVEKQKQPLTHLRVRGGVPRPPLVPHEVEVPEAVKCDTRQSEERCGRDTRHVWLGRSGSKSKYQSQTEVPAVSGGGTSSRGRISLR